MAVYAWPMLNASLNALSAVLLTTGFIFIKQKRVAIHKTAMLMAFVSSVLFLISYLAYHAQVGSVHFPGHGWARPTYFLILITHTILAVVIVPLVLQTLRLALRGNWTAHVRWARRTLPLWLYVSVTGVVIYWMLYRSPWGVRV